MIQFTIAKLIGIFSREKKNIFEDIWNIEVCFIEFNFCEKITIFFYLSSIELTNKNTIVLILIENPWQNAIRLNLTDSSALNVMV